MMKQNPILITGGTGTVGSRIASRLIKLGYRVRIASRKRARLQVRSMCILIGRMPPVLRLL